MNDKWRTSRALLERARRSLAGGVSSPFRAYAPVPLYFKDGRGSRLTDADGNEYIDYTLAWGPNILGYRHPAVVEAVARAAQGPHTYGAQHEAEYLVAEQVQRLVPCAERVAFSSSGSEAVQLVLRLARAFTGRNLVLKFEGHYHGWMDSVLLSYHAPLADMGPADAPSPAPGSRGQVPNAGDNVVVAPWNRIDALERIFAEKGGEIAAVIMEPVLCNSGCLLPLPGYLEFAREISRRHGALLVFDEVITGFRLSLGGAQGHYNVLPDLATFGKAIGGGLALSAIAGRKEIFDLMFGGGVAFGGSMNGNPLSLAGAYATLGALSAGGGELLARANRLGMGLMEGIRLAAARHGLRVLVTGFGTAFALHFTSREELTGYRDTLEDNRDLLARFAVLALDEGVNFLPDGRFYVSAAHSETDAGQTLEALDRAFGRLAAGGA